MTEVDAERLGGRSICSQSLCSKGKNDERHHER
jgi:hypothetical protein